VNVPLHPDAKQILRRLRQERMTALYHFTSITNLRLIREMDALCSKAVLETAGCWPCPEPGGNSLSHSLDSVNGNWDKVSVSFTPHTPMVYRRKRASHLCFFVLRIEVAAYAGIFFTDRNAASKQSQRRAAGLAGLDLINFEAIRSHRPRPWDKEGWFEPIQAEVLIPGKVSLGDVKEVVFVSDASLQEGERVWGVHPLRPPFRVAPRYFYDSSRQETSGLEFPHLISFGLTNESIDKSTVRSFRTYYSRFRRQRNGRVTAVAKIYALAGTQARVTWNPGRTSKVQEFDISQEYWHWPSIPMILLPNGPCSVEYRLNEVCWATMGFQLAP
jgi:hypothetical protein